jgi:hypothetical protein
MKEIYIALKYKQKGNKNSSKACLLVTNIEQEKDPYIPV